MSTRPVGLILLTVHAGHHEHWREVEQVCEAVGFAQGSQHAVCRRATQRKGLLPHLLQLHTNTSTRTSAPQSLHMCKVFCASSVVSLSSPLSLSVLLVRAEVGQVLLPPCSA